MKIAVDIKGVVSVLNYLIQLNNERVAGYKYAISRVKDKNLKKLFKAIILESLALKSELMLEIMDFGEIPSDPDPVYHNVHSEWKVSESVLEGNNKNEILSCCLPEEYFILEKYKETTRSPMVFPVKTLDLLLTQKEKLEKTERKLNSMQQELKTV